MNTNNNRNELIALGHLVRKWRNERGKSQEQLAWDAGISRNALSLIERGAFNPTMSMLLQIAEALGVEMRVEFDE